MKIIYKYKEEEDSVKSAKNLADALDTYMSSVIVFMINDLKKRKSNIFSVKDKVSEKPLKINFKSSC